MFLPVRSLKITAYFSLSYDACLSLSFHACGCTMHAQCWYHAVVTTFSLFCTWLHGAWGYRL